MPCLSFIAVSLTTLFYVVSHLCICSMPSAVIKGVTEFTSPRNDRSGGEKRKGDNAVDTLFI